MTFEERVKELGRLNRRPKRARPTATLGEAVRWARAGAVLNPGITFSAIFGDRIYSERKSEHHNDKPE